jgi:hypothetical protein
MTTNIKQHIKQHIFDTLHSKVREFESHGYYAELTCRTNKLQILIDSHVNEYVIDIPRNLITVDHTIKFGSGKCCSHTPYPLKLYLQDHYLATQIKHVLLMHIANIQLKELNLSSSMLGVDCYETVGDIYSQNPGPPSGMDLILLTNILLKDNGLEVLDLSYNFVMFMDMPQEILVKFFAALETNTSIKKLIIRFTILTDHAMLYLANALNNNTSIETLVLEKNSFNDSKEVISSSNMNDAFYYKNLIDMVKRFAVFKASSFPAPGNQSFDQLIYGISNNTSLKDISLIGYNFTNTFTVVGVKNGYGFRDLFKHSIKKKLNVADSRFSINSAIHLAKGIGESSSIEEICINRNVINRNVINRNVINRNEIDVLSVPLTERSNLKKLYLTNIIATEHVVNTFIDILDNNTNIMHMDISYNKIMGRQIEQFSAKIGRCENLVHFRAHNTFVLLQDDSTGPTIPGGPLYQIMELLQIIERNKQLMYFGLTIQVSESYMMNEFYTDDRDKIIRKINSMLQSQLQLDYLDLQIFCKCDNLQFAPRNPRWIFTRAVNNPEVNNIIESLHSRRVYAMIPMSVNILDMMISDITVDNWSDGYAGHIKRKMHRVMQGELLLFLHHARFCNIIKKLSNIKISIVKNILEYLYKLRPMPHMLSKYVP